MDVIVQTCDGSMLFTIIVYMFDTVLQLKIKIQTQTGIPIHRQILLFNGWTLADQYSNIFHDLLPYYPPCLLLLILDDDYHHHHHQIILHPNQLHHHQIILSPSQLHHHQIIQPPNYDLPPNQLHHHQIILSPNQLHHHQIIQPPNYDLPPNQLDHHHHHLNDQSPGPASSSSTAPAFKKLKLLVKIPRKRQQFYELQMNSARNTVGQLKQRIRDKFSSELHCTGPVYELVSSGMKLLYDHLTLQDYGIVDNLPEVTVIVKVRPVPPPPSSSSSKSISVFIIIPVWNIEHSRTLWMDTSDTIGQLKQKIIQEIRGISVNTKFVLVYKGDELFDDNGKLSDYGFTFNRPDLELIMTSPPPPPPPPPPPSSPSNKRRRRLF